ncbi:MAG TPA: phage tail sheath family protein, partial [Thermoanaerobaculia bacterium]|nr:phage tail sheath family protein [Thermoanaerobaculia bacterium]
MPQYLAPGVYVEEVPSSVQPIAGAGTSTAGFIGHVGTGVTMPPLPGKFQTDSEGNLLTDSDGKLIPDTYDLAPAGEPQLITSWESFKNHFGDFHTDNETLAHAVYGFFNNGGTRCWVTRTAAALDAAAVIDALVPFETIDEIALDLGAGRAGYCDQG